MVIAAIVLFEANVMNCLSKNHSTMKKSDIIYTINRCNFIVIVYNTFVSHLLLDNTIVVLYGLLILKTYSKLALRGKYVTSIVIKEVTN